MIRLTELTWQGQEMTRDDRGYLVWVPTPNPVGGDRVGMGTLGMMTRQGSEPCTHYEVPCTLWGDYCGDGVQRSNYRSLLRDYPETFIEVYGDYGSHYLAMCPIDLTEELAEIFVNLVEQYPLYDEEDHSELEMEEATEQYQQWAKDDILFSLRRDYDIDTDNISETWLEQRFWQWCGEQSQYPYLEDAVSIVYPDMDGFVREMASYFGRVS